MNKKNPPHRTGAATSRKSGAISARAITPDRIDLRWPPVAGAHDYAVHLGGQSQPEGDEVLQAVTAGAGYACRGLACDTAYRFRVVARDADGAVQREMTAGASTPPEGLTTLREGNRLTIRGDAFELEWDLRQGGEITAIRQYDGDSWFQVNDPEAGTVPGLALTRADGEVLRFTEQAKTACVIERQNPRDVILAFTVPFGTFEVGLRYHVFREGALFCELTLPRGRVDDDRTQGVDAESNMRLLDSFSGRLGLCLAPELLSGKLAWGHFRRHAPYSRAHLGKRRTVRDNNQMLPLAMTDYGRNPAGGFTNRIEFFIEDSPPRGASTRFGSDGRGGFGFEWAFSGRAMRDLNFVCWDMGFLCTRWGLCLGACRKGGHGLAPASRRNNLLGARVFHAGGSQAILDHRAERWPFNVPPVTYKRNPETGLPSDDEIREAHRQGVSVIVAHQHWMRSGGSNCEPPADYIPRDPDDLRRFVDTCHRHGIRVGLYMRGAESYALFQPYFEQFLRRDYDGLYVDWNSPHSPGFQGCTELHFSAYNYFLFTRALRERVGERGFLIGHSGRVPCLLALACSDAYVVGEHKDQRDNFYRSPDQALHWGLSSCVGTHPLGGGDFPPERKTAYAAGLALSPHVRIPRQRHSMEGVWRILASIPMDRAVVYNAATENLAVVRTTARDIAVPVYRVDAGLLLVVAANLTADPVDVTLRLDTEALGMTGSYDIVELHGARREEFGSRRLAATSDGVIEAGPFGAYEVRGYRLRQCHDPASPDRFFSFGMVGSG